MKLLATPLLLLGSLLPVAASAQTVHPAGAPLTTLNWQPASNTDALNVDVDGDNVADVTFREANSLGSGAGQASTYRFTTDQLSADTEIALDSAEFDSAHRFAANDPIGRGLRWSTASAYLAYTIVGNGGTGGRGFFRNGATGYVVIRKRVAGTWTYWWFNVTGRTNTGSVSNSRVSFYGRSVGVLSVSSPAAAAVQVFPNPAASSWRLAGSGSYQLFDATGRQLRQGQVATSATVEASDLATGIYFLHFRAADGTVSHHRLLRK